MLPPPPVDTSEVPAPGVPSPKPLPVPDEPVGGAMLAGCDLLTAPSAAAPPAEVTARSWLIADLENGQVLAAKQPHGRFRPASTIKLLTSLVTIRELDMSETLVATQADANQEGSRVGLEPGVTYTVEQVLTGLLLQSGNDAAHALAMKLGGAEAMVAEMNELAVELGALDTRAATPSGLDGPGMSTSAYDLAVIFRAAMRTPEFTKAISTENTVLPGPPGQPPLQVWNDNRVLLNYPGALGGKTGFTDDARHTYVAAAERDGRRLVAVLLRGENQPVRLSKQAMGLLDYGFGGALSEPVGSLVAESPSPSEQQPRAGATDGVQPAQASGQSSMFGTVGGPLVVLTIATIMILGALTVRQRRMRLAAAARRSREDRSDEHA
ncbi:D-alanyl-D-alanine carboxypeptidase family protein [Parasphingorhabdus pacifica]